LRQTRVKGMAHITGGGLVENVPRVLPEAAKAVITRSSWPVPPLFRWLQREGNVADGEMHRVFNCGIGMVVVVGARDADAAARSLEGSGEKVFRIGRIEERKAGEPAVLIA
jgi:phosphoribosylformylglycinamidine cyclo-ligase